MADREGPIRVAYLGPAGTFSEDALLTAGGGRVEDVPKPTIFDAIQAVASGEVERALVPFENSIEGAVRATLDALAFDVEGVAIVGEHDHPVRHALIARPGTRAEEVEVVLSHPQANAQCARFIRERLPQASVRAASSTAEAVRSVSLSKDPWAALGAPSAARLYSCEVLADGVEDAADNVTRFVWLARADEDAGGAAAAADPGGSWRTTLIFSELGDDHPGALVEALTELSSRDVNLTRIESRPLRRGLGRYMFFVDLEGRAGDEPVAAAIEGLRGKAESVRVLGSYPVLADGVPLSPGAVEPAAAGDYNRAAMARTFAGVAHASTTAGGSTSATRVLVLNATYEPINVCTVRRAAVLVLKQKAEVLEEGRGQLRSERFALERPAVIRLVTYVRVPRDVHRRKITRKAVLARDSWTCQYCGSSKPGLTVDHVIPRSRGGESVWENIVASCAPCNRRKADKMPREARMHPRSEPRPPGPTIFIRIAAPRVPSAWEQYLVAA